MARSKRLKKEEISEIWCFKCKHGGELRLCDNTRCLKVYHPECVDKDESFLAAKTKWICICKTCLYDIQFALVKENKGFCNSCLELAWLIETKKDVNYDGFDRSDPGERNRFYFKGYWQKIKEKESLTPENVISAYYLLKKGEMHKLVSNTFASYEGEEDIDGFEDEILFHMSDYIAFIYTEEHNLSLCWNKKRKRSNRKTSGKKEKPQLLHEGPVVLGDAEDVEAACKDFTRTKQQEHNGGLPKSYPGSTCEGNAASCNMPLEHVESVSEESSLARTSKHNGVSSYMPSERPLLSNEVSEVIATAQPVQRASEDFARANEQVSFPELSVSRASEGNVIPCDMLPDFSVAPPSQPSTAAFQSELPEASAPPSQPATTVCKPEQKAIMIDLLDERDVKEEREEINLLHEKYAFFEDLQSLLDQSLEDLSGPSDQPPVTDTLSPDQIMEVKCCLHKFCLMNFAQLTNHAERDQFFSSLDLLLNHGFIPRHMLDMVTDLHLKFSSNTFLYSECLESVKSCDEERDRALSIKQELADNYRLYSEIESKKRVADDWFKELRNQLRDARNLRNGLDEQCKSLKASLETSKGALHQYMQSSKTLAMSKQTGQQLMKDIDESWNSSKTEILNLLLGISP
ncbi:hypothetical protein KPL71_013924 [Citrus sinensis]|uniref:Uncharacterized protein n=1 Tax=Citrus sinensis TaxID=2711 RepID=A0ACB8K878_CITSI|nr:hypothetical protein KPL71_013924 [Citrus sinensis]